MGKIKLLKNKQKDVDDVIDIKEMQKIFKDWEYYKQKGKNLHHWCLDQEIEFLQRFSDDNVSKKDSHLLVMMGCKSYMLEKNLEYIPEDESFKYITGIQIEMGLTLLEKKLYLKRTTYYEWYDPDVAFKCNIEPSEVKRILEIEKKPS